AEADTLQQQQLAGDSILLAVGANPTSSAFFGQVLYGTQSVTVPQRTVVLTFTSANFSTPQVVSVAAVNDSPNDSYPGTRVYEISSSVLSADPVFENAPVRMVEVTKIDNSQPGIDVVNLGNTNTPIGATTPGGTTVYRDGNSSGTTTLTSFTAAFNAGDIGR